MRATTTAKKDTVKKEVKEEKKVPGVPEGGSFAKKAMERKQAMQTAPAKTKPMAAEDDSLTITVLNKGKRALADERNKYPLNEVKGDPIDRMQQYCVDAFGQKFSDQMFAKNIDFGKHVKCCEALMDLVDTSPDDVLEVLDLIFKWANLRVNDSSNTKLLLSVFDLFGKIIECCASRDHKLAEFEALILIGTLCEKTGNGNRTLQDKARRLLKQSLEIYDKKPAFRIIINQGVKSKN